MCLAQYKAYNRLHPTAGETRWSGNFLFRLEKMKRVILGFSTLVLSERTLGLAREMMA